MMAVSRQARSQPGYAGDGWLLVISVLLVAFGLVMMTSASIEIAESQYNDAFYHFKRQLRFLAMGLAGACCVLSAPVKYWKQGAVFLFVLANVLLALLLLPGVGREVNGSTRWLDLGFMTIQASEPAKLFLVVFLAWFLTEKKEWVRGTWQGFVAPLLLTLVPIWLLLQEPDFGAAVVFMIAVFGMLFMAGVKLYRFLLVTLCAAAGGAGLILSASYRVERLKSFIQALTDPFSEEVVYGTGYQLAQALIGFGRGEWFGVGLGNSIQKMYFLPEAHTDFVLAIIAEELGFITVLALIGLFVAFIARALIIARRNEVAGKEFAAFTAYGIAFLFTGQIVINIAVNVGLLPTKGLTLPLVSYGGSSLIMSLVMVALLLRLDIEHHRETRAGGTRARGD